MPTWRDWLSRSPPLLWVAAGLLAGDAAAGGWPMPYGWGAVVLFTSCAAVLLGAGRLSRRTGLLALAGLYGALAAERTYRPHFSDDHLVHFASRAPQLVEGELASEPLRRDGRVTLLVAASRIGVGDGGRPASGTVRLTVRHAARTWRSGDRVRLRTALRRPRNFGTPGEYDYVAHLARRGVYVTGYVDRDADIELLARPDAAIAGLLPRWRDRVDALIASTLAPPAAGVLRALIIGRDDGISREQRLAFSRAGVSHVLSISGLHVSLVASTAYAAQRWLLARSEWMLLTLNVPKCAVALSVFPVLLYAGIAGSNVATTRSVVMIVVFLGAVLVDRRRHLLASLAAAAIGILLTTPGASLDISFQLSFVAVLALALATSRFRAWWPGFAERRLLRLRLDWRARLWRPSLLYAVLSASALAASTPLTALHFNQVSVVAPFANALVVPVLGSLAVVLGLLAAFCEPLALGPAAILVRLAGLCTTFGVWMVDWIAALPGAWLRVPTPRLWEVALLYSSFAVWLLPRGRVRRGAVALVALAGLTDAAWRCVGSPSAGGLSVSFLSIGMAEAAVVEMPGGEVLLVDGGGLGDGSFDAGERLIAPFLWSRGLRRLDYVAISHPQFDHFGGLRFVVDEFAPREVWTGGREGSGKRWGELRASLNAAGVREVRLRRGDERDFGPVRVQVLNPSGAGDPHALNDDSLVLQIDYAGARILMTGDIEASAEAGILETGSSLRTDVLKVPHHGSRTSSSAGFLDAVRPRLAVISAGFENRFGFPDAGVVRRYLAGRAVVTRTDTDGAVEVRVAADGELRLLRHGYGGATLGIEDRWANPNGPKRPLGLVPNISVDSP